MGVLRRRYGGGVNPVTISQGAIIIITLSGPYGTGARRRRRRRR